MNTNDNIRNEVPEDVIELGVASVETKGGGGVPNEEFGLMIGIGISDE